MYLLFTCMVTQTRLAHVLRQKNPRDSKLAIPLHPDKSNSPDPLEATASRQRESSIVKNKCTRPAPNFARFVCDLVQSGLAHRQRAVLDLEQQAHDLEFLHLLNQQLRLVLLVKRSGYQHQGSRWAVRGRGRWRQRQHPSCPRCESRQRL